MSKSFGAFFINSANKSFKCEVSATLNFSANEKFTYQNLMRKLEKVYFGFKNYNYIITARNDWGCYFARISTTEDLLHLLKETNDHADRKSFYIVYNYDIDTVIQKSSLSSQYFCIWCCSPMKDFLYRCQEKYCYQFDICQECFDKKIHSDNHHILEYVEIPNSQNHEDMAVKELDYSQICVLNKIGQGGGGEVFKGHFVDSPHVKLAIKKVRDSDLLQRSLTKELKAFERIGSHENIVKIQGYCNLRREVVIVMEYVSLTQNNRDISSLCHYLRYMKNLSKRKGCENEMKGKELASFVIQIARGMTHLESKGIIHRDLATRNVLINDRKIVKIADFGLSQTTYYQGNANAVSVRWAAPEVLKYQDFTHQSDVWSFGVTCWEIYNSGERPYNKMSNEAVCEFVKGGQNLGEELYLCMCPLFYSIVEACWRYRAYERPSFSTVLSKLTDLNWIKCC